MGAAVAICLLFADAADEAYLQQRLRALSEAFEEQAHRQGPVAVRQRAAILRELGHLPYTGQVRAEAARFLGRVVTRDRSFRVRADAARALGRLGTPEALASMYAGLFPAKQPRRFDLLETVLPDALAGLRDEDGVRWLGAQVLDPVLARRDTALLRRAGGRRGRLVLLTLDGIGRGASKALAPRLESLARTGDDEVARAALAACARLGVARARVVAAARSADPVWRAAAAEGHAVPASHTAGLLADADVHVRWAALRGARRRPAAQSIPMLVERLGTEPEAALRLALAEDLHRATGKEFGSDAQLWRTWWNANARGFAGPVPPVRDTRPYFFDVGLRTRRVLFVVDVSASMTRTDAVGRSRHAVAAEEVRRAVERLPSRAEFAVLAFAAEVRRYPRRHGAPRGKGEAAEAWLNRVRPGGATNTYAALMLALEDPLLADTVVLLTDGNPYRCSFEGRNYSEHEQILAEVRRVNARRHVRIHAVGLFTAAAARDEAEDEISASDFLRRLAAEHGGEFREVRS